jgi:hypothetical protein
MHRLLKAECHGVNKMIQNGRPDLKRILLTDQAIEWLRIPGSRILKSMAAIQNHALKQPLSKLLDIQDQTFVVASHQIPAV